MAARRRKRILPSKALKLRVAVGVVSRFIAKVEQDENGCWLWTAHADEHGYGKFRIGQQVLWAHRVAYALFRGPLRDGEEVDHKRCKNPRCVNPWHLRKCPMPVNRADTRRRCACAEPAPF